MAVPDVQRLGRKWVSGPLSFGRLGQDELRLSF